MPTDIKLDPNTHDLDLSGGTVELHTKNSEAVGQRVKVAILKKRGEWFKDISAGIPYYQEFFSKKNNKQFVDAFMIEYITAVEDVVRVVAYESTITTGRELVTHATVETNTGEIIQVQVGDV